MRMLSLLVLCALVPGCRKAGAPCSVSGGQDPCATRCLNVPMNCPDGAHTNPEVCAGPRCDGPEDCVTGWLCLPYEHDEDLAYCAPAHVCGE